MITAEEIIKGQEKISLVGLGYVGLPIAVAFSKKARVLGFDSNSEKISTYKSGKDPTGEVGDKEVAACTVDFTSDASRLREARFHIVAVPTPVRADKTPDLAPVKSASRTVGQNLVKGSVVVYESTVYPGVTEEVCVPILEEASGMRCGRDFFVGYSPERINPGDENHRLWNIVKIVSGMDEKTLDIVAKTYELVIEAGVYRASGIRVAEAAKVIENCQRDINIAFMNELALIFGEMGIDTHEVLEAAGTKWNFLPFRPGLVGGHCIGVDPYYLTYCAEQYGYHSQIILAGRRINDGMGKYVAERVVKQLIKAGVTVKGAKVAVLGLTFKENCPDTRNTRVVDIIQELGEYGIVPLVYDPIADAIEAKREYGIVLASKQELLHLDAVIGAVAHDCFCGLNTEDMLNESGIVADVKGVLAVPSNHLYWRL
ncbi:MAG: nucleotide sugar dehydrogenase [Oscillospiraceae bacterium]